MPETEEVTNEDLVEEIIEENEVLVARETQVAGGLAMIFGENETKH